MKKVFSSTAEIANLWAAQTQPEARTGSNTRFRGDTLYSYGTSIARIVPGSNGSPVALISSRSYSSGTSKVQGEARAAAKNAGMPVFIVPVLIADEAGAGISVQAYEDKINDSLDRVERARFPESWRLEAQATIETCTRFVAMFGGIWSWNGRDPATVLSKVERAAA